MSRTKKVIEAYEAWDPDKESSAELAERLGISKARLYQILDQEGVTPKARRPRGRWLSEIATGAAAGWMDSSRETDSELVRMMAERGVRSLLDELEQLRREVAEYRKRFGPLDSDD